MQDDPTFAVTDAAKRPLGSHDWGNGFARLITARR